MPNPDALTSSEKATCFDLAAEIMKTKTQLPGSPGSAMRDIYDQLKQMLADVKESPRG